MSVTGGGVAITYTEEHFYVEDAGIETPEGIEAAWVRLTPKKSVKKNLGRRSLHIPPVTVQTSFYKTYNTVNICSAIQI